MYLPGKFDQCFAIKAIANPFRLRQRADAQIEINGWLVPVQNTPFQAATLALYRTLRDVFQ
jgi:hypothetical protein